jgi:phosphate transport system protein
MSKLPSHTDRAFDQDLDELAAAVRDMGQVTLGMVADAASLFGNGASGLVDRIVATDTRLDELRDGIEQRGIITIARRQPVANDLRSIVAALRIATALERVGDLAKNVARRTVRLDGAGAPGEGLQAARRMMLRAHDNLAKVLDAYETGDVAAAEAVWRNDTELDGMLNSLFRELLTYMAENPRAITACAHLLFCAKNAERIGDHATTVAEAVRYAVSGTAFEGERPKLDTVNT